MACFFGFGSLVNTATHHYTAISPARLAGWARAWINNDRYQHAFLSVIPLEGSHIQGLIAQVPNDDWAALDEREQDYTRRLLKTDEYQLETIAPRYQTLLSRDVQMYVHTKGTFAQTEKPILWSYLETVLFGYYQLFGANGVQAFIDSTQHWTRILDDRHQPLYPRYRPVTGQARSVVMPAIEQLPAPQTA